MDSPSLPWGARIGAAVPEASARSDKPYLADFGYVYETHYRQVASYLWRRTGDAELTEELVAETFLRAWRNREQFRGAVPVLHWLLGIATHAVHGWLRRRRLEEAFLALVRRSCEVFAPATAEPARRAAAEDELAFVRRALERVPARQQDVLTLHCVEGLRLGEIAAVLGVAEGTVKSRLSRAREALRLELVREGARTRARRAQEERP